jgi:hypothetical protein
MYWATQMAPWLVKTASSLTFCVALAVDHPPNEKPMIIATTAPPTIPQIPTFTFSTISAFIDPAFLAGVRFCNPSVSSRSSVNPRVPPFRGNKNKKTLPRCTGQGLSIRCQLPTKKEVSANF